MRFLRFRIDHANQCLWDCANADEERRVVLAPKAHALLTHLFARAGQLVTQEELLDSLWPNTYVQPEVLKHHVMEIRRTLEDDPRNPRYIETLPRRGYRFIAPLSPEVNAPARRIATPVTQNLVGRAAAFEALRKGLQLSRLGQNQFIVVTGEPGIGKTALVDAFQRQAKESLPELQVAIGQCVEGFGSREGYYPLLEALGQLCHGPSGGAIVDILAKQAPTWLVQFPALLSREHRQTLQQELLGATGARMLREIGDALQAITAQQPLLLILEDLQWVDNSTVDALSALARRRSQAKLTLLATIRPIDSMPPDHPLKALLPDLLIHDLCSEIPLARLTRAHVAEYLTASAPTQELPGELAELVHRHSGGNPLFMTLALDHLKRRGLVSCDGGIWRATGSARDIGIVVPDTLRQMVEAQIERLSREENHALEVASVVGAVFSGEVAAAMASANAEDFEDLYGALARRHRIIRPVEYAQFGNKSDAPQYEFAHALYREVLYRRQPQRSRIRLHRRAGAYLEKLPFLPGNDVRLADLATQLVHHFENGMEWRKALHYTRIATDVAVKRCALNEAFSILGRGIDFVSNLPSDEQTSTELQLLERSAMIASANYLPSALERYELLERRAGDLGRPDAQVRALLGQAFSSSWADLSRSEEVISRAIELNRLQGDPTVRTIAHASSHFWRLWIGGWNDESAEIFRSAAKVIEASAHRHSVAWYRLENTFIQFMASQYRDCRHVIAHELPILLEESDDAPEMNLGLAYWGCQQFVRPWSAIFLGEWVAAGREFEEEITVLERNRALYLANTLRLIRAWGQVIAGAFEGAREVCESIQPGSDSSGAVDSAFPTTFLPCEERVRLVSLGAAQVGLGQFVVALQNLETVRRQMLEMPVFLDWYWRRAVEWALAQLWIAQGNPVRAKYHATQMLDLTSGRPEATWRTLALDVAARVAIIEGDLDHASEFVAEALSTSSSFDGPVATWKAEALAATFYAAIGDSDLALRHRENTEVATRKLRGTLPSNHPFRT